MKTRSVNFKSIFIFIIYQQRFVRHETIFIVLHHHVDFKCVFIANKRVLCLPFHFSQKKKFSCIRCLYSLSNIFASLQLNLIFIALERIVRFGNSNRDHRRESKWCWGKISQKKNSHSSYLRAVSIFHTQKSSAMMMIIWSYNNTTHRTVVGRKEKNLMRNFNNVK